jgi:hypothetical protein
MRRAQHPVNAVFILIVAVLVIMLSITLVIAFNKFFAQQEEDAPCAAAIVSHAAIVQYTGGKSAPEITCPTSRVVLKGSDEQIKAGIAKQMKRCWDLWGKGQYELFGRDASGQEREGMYCHMCSVVTVEGGPVIKEFPQYLDTTNAAKGLTYSQYLSGVKSGTYFDDQAFADKTGDGALQTQKPVAIIFVHSKGLEGYKRFYNQVVGDTATSAGAGAVGGVAAGAGVVYMIGAAASATGVGIPLGLAIIGGSTIVLGGTVAGAGTGTALSIWGTADAGTMSAVVVRPVGEDASVLGCQYDPVGN